MGIRGYAGLDPATGPPLTANGCQSCQVETLTPHYYARQHDNLVNLPWKCLLVTAPGPSGSLRRWSTC